MIELPLNPAGLDVRKESLAQAEALAGGQVDPIIDLILGERALHAGAPFTRAHLARGWGLTTPNLAQAADKSPHPLPEISESPRE